MHQRSGNVVRDVVDATKSEAKETESGKKDEILIFLHDNDTQMRNIWIEFLDN